MNSWTLKITHIKRKLKSLVSPTTGRVYVNLLEGNLYMVIVLIKKLLRGSVLLSFKNHAPLGCVSKTCMNHVSCVHMPGAGIGWMKIITKNHANGKQKSDGCRILRIASAICLRVSRALSNPTNNDLILLVFTDFKEYHDTPTYQAVTWWATWETHTQNIYHE